MVFHFHSPGYVIPIESELVAISQAYDFWENSGLLVGYGILRSQNSIYERNNVWSIDDRSRAVLINKVQSRPGFIPFEEARMLPGNVAPIIRYGTVERGMHSGRTYAIGITEDAAAGNEDLAEVDGLYTAALTTIFRELGLVVQSATGYTHCHFTPSPRGGLVPGGNLLDITDVGCYVRMGTRRRRLRPSSN